MWSFASRPSLRRTSTRPLPARGGQRPTRSSPDLAVNEITYGFRRLTTTYSVCVQLRAYMCYNPVVAFFWSMAMDMNLDAFWTARFEANTTHNSCNGVAVIHEGHVYGGDAAFTYIGSVETDSAGNVTADIEVQRYAEGMSVFGPRDHLAIALRGRADGDSVNLHGPVAGHPGAELFVHLTRRAALH
jgi:hypothetical protein